MFHTITIYVLSLENDDAFHQIAGYLVMHGGSKEMKKCYAVDGIRMAGTYAFSYVSVILVTIVMVCISEYLRHLAESSGSRIDSDDSDKLRALTNASDVLV